jgi:hypothetical protein
MLGDSHARSCRTKNPWIRTMTRRVEVLRKAVTKGHRETRRRGGRVVPGRTAGTLAALQRDGGDQSGTTE